jgi:hypothetical protein
VTFLELLGFGRKLGGPVGLADLLELAEAPLDTLDLGGKLGRQFGRLRVNRRGIRTPFWG